MILNLPGTISYDFQRPWVYRETRDGLIVADFLSMQSTGSLLALNKHCVGNIPKGGGRPTHNWGYRMNQENLTPFASHRIMVSKTHQQLGRSSWVSIAG